jgi:hypothetical protein
MKRSCTLLLLLVVLIFTGCNPKFKPAGSLETPDSLPTGFAVPFTDAPSAKQTAPVESMVLTPTLTQIVESPTPKVTETTKPTLAPNAWMELPVVPAISARVAEIYQRGVELGNNPLAFSKVGDCGSTPAWFLGDFDRGTKYYRLGEYHFLEAVIQEFQGSFDRTSLAAKSGFNASSVLTTLWANRSYCQSNETPLACEYRQHRPIFAFITLGTNDVWHLDTFEPQMRRIIEFSIENGVVPILSTKADNEEGNGIVNATIARLAYEYDIPLWNYWLAVQPLPDHGLQEDGAHITWGPNRFDDPQAMKKGWTVRNLTALLVLDAVWRSVDGSAQ